MGAVGVRGRVAGAGGGDGMGGRDRASGGGGWCRVG